jgi:hypothetical protein
MKACVFLDLLGFKYYVYKDIAGAIGLLSNYQTIIHTKIMVSRIRKEKKEESEEIRKLIEQGRISSFDCFLPFSDSILIQASKPDLLIPQLSNFLLNTFLLTSRAYAIPESLEDPSIVTIRTVGLNEAGSAAAEDSKAYWFPVMFRGGIAYGECHAVQINSLINGSPSSMTNLVGKAVIEAVQIESSGIKGPRLICTRAFIEALQDKYERHIVEFNKDGKYFEILWPTFTFIEGNDVNLEMINQFEELFVPAVNLWKSNNHTESGIHYYNFLKLIITSTLHYFSFESSKLQIASRHIASRLRKVDMELKIKDLMGIHAL